MINFPKEFLLKIPKTDLHLHLDGSLRLSTLIELAKKEHVNHRVAVALQYAVIG